MKRVFLFIIVLISCTVGVRAQDDMQLSQYFMSMGYYNPAYAGTTGDLNMLGLFHQQWIGMPNASTAFLVVADMPIKFGSTNHGIGLAVNTESIGLDQSTKFGFQYAYKQKLFGGILSGGLQVGIFNRAFDGTKVHIPEDNDYYQQEDEAIPRTAVQAMALDVNLGLYYTHKNFYAGVGVTHITEPELHYEENASSYLSRGLNLTGGYNIQLRNPLYELQPSVFLMTNMQNSFLADITGRVVYNKMFNGGFSWRVNNSVALLLGATFGRLQVGYSYEYPTTAIRKASSGGHEVLVRYQLKLKKTKTGKNRHKSVRIL